MIFFDIFLGIFLGFFLGLIPSFHINILAYLFIAVNIFLLFPDNIYFFFSLAITMTITSLVPLLLFNTATVDNFSLILGQNHTKDITPYILGFLFGSIFSILLLPLFYLLFILFSDFYIFIFLILFAILTFLVFRDADRPLALLIIFFAGTLGVITLKYNFFFSEPLLPCIFGLFALPVLVESLFNKTESKGDIKSVQEMMCFKPTLIYSFLGSLFSSIIAIIPSLSPGMAQVIPSTFSQEYSKTNHKIILSSTLISVILIYFFMAAVFKKSRIGYVSILLEKGAIFAFSFPDTLLLCFVFLFVVSISCLFFYLSFPELLVIISRIPKTLTLICVIVFSILLIILVTNLFSIFLILLSFSIGYLPIVYNKNKLLLMSYLIIPTILFFI